MLKTDELIRQAFRVPNDSYQNLYDMLSKGILNEYKKLLRTPVIIDFFGEKVSCPIEEKKRVLEKRFDAVCAYLTGKLPFCGKVVTQPSRVGCTFCGDMSTPLVESDAVQVCPNCFSCSNVVDNYSASSEFYKNNFC